MKPIKKSGPAVWRRIWLPAGLLLAATFLAYWPALHGGFVWDDDTHISANPTLRSWRGLWNIWFQPGSTCQYYPLSFTLFWAGYHLWGLNPLGYHLLNVALHGLVAVLLWQVLERLKVRGAWLAGAIFALHPICVMSVAWMTELKNTLSASLALGAGWAYLRFAGLGVYDGVQSNRSKRMVSEIEWRYGILSLVLFLMAMFAKTAVSFLPATLLLITWWQRGRLTRRELAPLTLMLILVAVMGKVTFYIEHLHGATGMEFSLGWEERLLVSGRSFWFYLGKLFFPHPLVFIYERWDVSAAPGWQYVLYPAATIGLFALLWWKRNTIGRGPLVALSHYYVSTSLLILIVVLYMTRYTYVSDHWQYFGCMSVFALVAAGVTPGLDWLEKKRRFLKPALVGTLLMGLGLLTWYQCGKYAGIETLWRDTLARNPHAYLAYNNLGSILSGKGQMDEAIADFQKTLAIDPNFIEARNNLGNALLRTGRLNEALDQFKQAVAIAPGSATSDYNLGNALLQAGRLEEAISWFHKALDNQADYPEAHNNLGVALMQLGQLEEASTHYRKALALNPDYAEAHYNLGRVLTQGNQMDEAVAHYRRAIEIRPNYTDAYCDLANVLTSQGRLNEAILAYQRALELMPNSAQVHFRYGQALQTQRRYQRAIAEYQKTLYLDSSHLPGRISLAWLLATCPEDTLRDGNQAVALSEQAILLAGIESPQLLDTVAAAYAEAGRFPEAVETARRALNLPATKNNPPLAEAVQDRLKLYEAHIPYHENP